jgi:hypothetical protein
MNGGGTHDGGARAGIAGIAIARRPRPWLWVLGLLSAATFWIPIWTPFVPLATLATIALPATRRTADRMTLWIAGGGGAAGLALYLLLEFVWVV